MIGRVTKSLYGTNEGGLRLGVPAIWGRALDLNAGDKVDVVFDEVLVVVPRKSAQADRVLKAMRETR